MSLEGGEIERCSLLYHHFIKFEMEFIAVGIGSVVALLLLTQTVEVPLKMKQAKPEMLKVPERDHDLIDQILDGEIDLAK